MAHEIDQTTGRAAVFTAGEAAWHRLGVNVSQAQTSDEAIELAGLDWTVEPKALAAAIADGEWAPVFDRVANVRTDTNAVLGIVGHGYRAFQNREAFDFMDALVGEKLAMFETAGALKGGRRVWMMARIPGEYRAAGDDVVKPYVLLTNSHDGTQALRMLPTTTRVVCQNTLNLALRQGKDDGLSIWHTESLDERVEQARENLGIITQRMQQFESELASLVAKPMRSLELQGFWRKSLAIDADREPTKYEGKIVDQFLANFDNERNTLPGIQGTAWAAYNAVSEWADHQSRVTGKTPEAKDDNRLNSIWFGNGNRVKQQAYSAALALSV